MPFLTLGVVSNVWGALLAETSIQALCAEAAGQGYGYVELRQRALGECEAAWAHAAPQPIPARLAELARNVPGLRFNLAVEEPFLSGDVPVDEEGFAVPVAAAAALGGEPPLLRLVDVTPAETRLPPDDFAAAVRRVNGLVRQAAREGVRLALENSRQPLSVLRELIEIASEEAGEADWAPLLCWDAANQATAVAPEDPHAFADQLRADRLALFHFKQLRGGVPQPEVDDGEIDWRRILRRLRDKAYRGPALFEIPPGPDIRARLDQSRRYIQGILREMEEL
jgi:sugar phosphate isomerase/epimerase